MAIHIATNDDYSMLATALQRMVRSGFFVSVTYDSEADSVICHGTEGAVLTISRGTNVRTCSIIFRFNDSSSKTWTFRWGQGNNSVLGGVYISSGGAYLYGMDSTASNALGYMIISKTNNDSLGIIIPTVFTSRIGSLPLPISADDDTSYVTSTGAKISLCCNLPVYSSEIRNTPLTQSYSVPVPTVPPIGGSVSYFPTVHMEIITPLQYVNNVQSPPCYTVRGKKRYLWVGAFLILDEEE